MILAHNIRRHRSLKSLFTQLLEDCSSEQGVTERCCAKRDQGPVVTLYPAVGFETYQQAPARSVNRASLPLRTPTDVKGIGLQASRDCSPTANQSEFGCGSLEANPYSSTVGIASVGTSPSTGAAE
jgi:hypothetical protein